MTTQERTDLLDVLRKHRGLFRVTASGLTDEQARLTPTVSSLSIGGLVKHVTAVEETWQRFVVDGPAPSPEVDWANVDWSDPPPEVQAYADGFGCCPRRRSPGCSRGTTRWPPRPTSS